MIAPLATATALRRVVMMAGDLDRTARFYADAFAATPCSRGPLTDPAWLRLLGLAGRTITQLVMRVGAMEVAFLAADPGGAPYPEDSTSSDLWFQHIALVVGDMDAAYARARAAGARPITRGGPARLPASSGGVRAFKFRDPDGHPLELLAFPDGTGPRRWRGADGDTPIRGIDHSAIAVADVDRSAAFYAATLGLARTAATVNRGPAQIALDDVPADVVDVVALSPREPTPHLELLGYRTGSRRPIPADAGPADIAATRLIVAVIDAAPLVTAASPHVSLDNGAGGVALVDPDGHRLVAVEAGPPSAKL